MYESRHALIRTTLITYGVAGLSWLLSRSGIEAQALGGFASARTLFTIGVVVQIVLGMAHWLLRRRIGDAEAATRSSSIVDLIGDGATVFLFALGTLGAVLHFPAQI